MAITPKDQPRVFNIAVTITAAEDEALRAACEAYNVSISTAVRHLINLETNNFTDFRKLTAVQGQRHNLISLEERRRRYAAEGHKTNA